VNDLFNNYVEPASNAVGYAEFAVSFTNLNMTTEPSVPDEGYIHIGSGEYKFNATLFKRGNYRLDIRLKNTDGKFMGISGSPFYLEVQPNNASKRYSFVNGTGVDINDAAYVGRVENINLYVKDIYDNFYNQTEFKGLKSYNVTGRCNGTEYVPVNDTISQPIYGYYQLDYRILRFCTNITINVTIATYNLNTS
jgi:hypothetical protein